MKEERIHIPGTEIPAKTVIDSLPAPLKPQVAANPKDTRAALTISALTMGLPREVRPAEIRALLHEEANRQWEKNQAERTPEEREQIKKHVAEESARIRAIPLETIEANMRSWHRASQIEEARKQAYIHAGDPLYDPMTGELLKPDEHPLSPTSEYLITGKTRPRRFVPPGSPHLKEYQPLEIQEDMQPEGEYNERLIQRLIKAGFTEVAPVGDDWQYFAFCERLRHMSPAEISREWQEIQRAMREGTPLKKEYPPENDWLLLLCKMLKDMMKALINDQIEEDERQRKQSSPL